MRRTGTQSYKINYYCPLKLFDSKKNQAESPIGRSSLLVIFVSATKLKEP